MGFFSPKNTPENAVKAQIDAKLAFINDKYTEIGRYVKLRMADKIEEPEEQNSLKWLSLFISSLLRAVQFQWAHSLLYKTVRAIIITLFHLLIISHRLIPFMAILLSRMSRQPLLSLSLLWHRLLHLSHSLKQHLSLHQCHSLLR